MAYRSDRPTALVTVGPQLSGTEFVRAIASAWITSQSFLTSDVTGAANQPALFEVTILAAI